MSFRILDLCCGGGGAAAGYASMGFEVTGVDITPQPHYPYAFLQGDCLSFPLEGYDVIHISPPCQRWSRQVSCRPQLRDRYPDLITPVRPRLEASGIPYVIENVPGAPLRDPVMLCGAMFGREIYRHRLFECGNGIYPGQPWHGPHAVRASRAGHWEPGTFMSVAGHIAPVSKAREVMGIDWLPREEMAEAVPPYFTAYIGAYLLGQLTPLLRQLTPGKPAP